MRVGFLVVLSLLLVPMASANVIHVQPELQSGGAACASTVQYAMAPEPTPGKAYSACSVGGAWTANFDHTLDEDFTFTGPLEINWLLGCDVPAVFAGSPGTTSVRFIVYLNGEDVTGNVNFSDFNACLPGDEIPLSFSVNAEGRTLSAGQSIRVSMLVFGLTGGAGGPAENVHVITGEGGSHIMSPGLGPVATEAPAGPVLTYGSLDEASHEMAFSNATDDDYQLNFTGALENGTVSFDWNATSGNVSALLMDGNGTEIFNGTFEGNGTESVDFMGATLGNWSLMLDYSNFTGSFGFSVHETPEETDGSGGSSGSGGNGQSGSGSSGGPGQDDHDDDHSDGTGNATGNETLDGDDGQEAPFTPIAWVLIGLGVVAVLRRRD